VPNLFVPFRNTGVFCRLLLLYIIFVPLGLNHAADQSTELLPRDPSAWLNSPPLTTSALQGKGAVLWFFEETCPNCRGKWPAMYELAKRYEGQPVVFIAVNSGNSPAAVAQYAKDVKLTWPIIVDPTRQFEKLWMDKEISLQNIHQCELLLPTGQKQLGQWNDLDASVQTALKGAAWKIDPKTIPSVFLSTWKAVELGNYAAAADLLKKGLVTKNVEVKEAATRVNDFVQSELRTAVELAAETRRDGDTWHAYQLYRGINTSFTGYDLPPEVVAAQKDLAGEVKVKRQVEAVKTLEAIQKSWLAAKTDSARKKAIDRLQQFASQFSDTDAGSEARRALDGSAQQ
jgi:thiol-disulfide isomerase/thioredoxin